MGTKVNWGSLDAIPDHPDRWKPGDETMPQGLVRGGRQRANQTESRAAKDESFEAFSLPLGAGKGVKGVSHGPNGEVRVANRKVARDLAKKLDDTHPGMSVDFGT